MQAAACLECAAYVHVYRAVIIILSKSSIIQITSSLDEDDINKGISKIPRLES